MNAARRREAILAWVQQDGRVQVRDLVERLGVSEMTVRRDLEFLAARGHVIRTYGGAVSTEHVTRDAPYAAKAQVHTAEKERIAQRAAGLVREGNVVLLDAGSTTAALARALRGAQDLTVVTIDLKIALELCDEPGIRVLVTGGTAQREGYNLYGPLAEQTLHGLTVDIAFLGASAVDVEYGITTPTLEKVPLKRAMIRAARHPVLLADASKFGLRATFQICPLSSFSRIITDNSLPAEVLRAIRKEGVEVDIV